MRLLISLLGLLIVINSNAQSISNHKIIGATYSPNQFYLEQAVETILATSIIVPKTAVEYRSGRSIQLLPGFQAIQGSTLTAHIKNVVDAKLQLKAYPNPFDRSTTITFDMPDAGTVDLFLVNEKGQVVEYLLQNSYQTAGKHQLEWKADSYSSGVYISVLKNRIQQVSSRIIKK